MSNLPQKRRVALLAGGSGITPIFAIAQASTLSQDGMEIWLLYSNKTKKDILLKDQLDELAAKNPLLKVHYTLTRHDESVDGEWDGLEGRIAWPMLQQLDFPEAADDVFYVKCGPKEFDQAIDIMLGEQEFINGHHCM